MPFPDEDVALLMGRLESVARELVLEPASAQDLVQDAWLTVLRSGSPSVRHPLRWMKVVMRRRWMRQRARETLRRECEEFAARVEATRDEDALELASSAALVMSELTQLDSPYRDVLRMRFLEDRPIREIAEHFGSTPETVRSQVHRGLARLRERLDRRAGSRELWAGMLLSATGLEREAGLPESAALELVSGAPVVSLGVLAFSLIAITAGFAAWFAKPTQPDSHSGLQVAGSAAPAGTVLSADSVERTREVITAVPVEALARAIEEPVAIPPIPPDVARLRLAVRNADDAPIVDIDGDFFGRDRKSIFDGELDRDGQAVIDVGAEDLIEDPLMMGGVVVSMCAPGLAWSDTFTLELELGKERSIEVVLDQPACVLTGFVIDSNWEPIVGARVDASAVPSEVREIEPGVHAVPKMVQTRTDEEGRFRIEDLPPTSHALRITGHGYLELVSTVAPSPPDEEAELVLELGASASLEGVVSYADGRPATQAVAWVGASFPNQHLQARAKTDERGAYQLFGFPYETPTRIFVCDENDPALFVATTVVARQGEIASFDAVLQTTPGVSVRAVESSGTPVAGAMVVVAAQEPISDWSARVVLDQDGRGVVQHVPDEPLELRVYPSGFFGTGDSQAFRSGVRPSSEELVLTLGQEHQLDGELAGRILRPDGRAPENAIVYATLVGFSERDATPAGGGRFGQAGLRQASIDRDGSFLLQVLQPGRYEVYVLCDDASGAGIVAGGAHEVFAAQRSEVGLLSLPAPTSVRLTLAGGESAQFEGPLLLAARMGPYVKSFMRRDAERALAVDLFPGDYIVRFHKGGDAQSFRVDGDGDFELTLPP